MNRTAKKIDAREAMSRAERKLGSTGHISRTAWLIAGVVAAAVTVSVIVWEVLDRSEEPETAPDGEPRTEHM